MDYRGKWPEATILRRTTSQKITSLLTKVFARFGNLKVLLSENWSKFTSEEFEGFLKLDRIQHCSTSPYFPKAKGQVERFHRYLEHSICEAELDGFLLTEVLPDILQVYRSTSHAGTGMTPARVMLNREISTKLPVALEREKCIVPGEQYKRCQEKLREGRTWSVGLDRCCICGNFQVIKGKLLPNSMGIALSSWSNKEVITLSWSKWRPEKEWSGMQNSLERLPGNWCATAVWSWGMGISARAMTSTGWSTRRDKPNPYDWRSTCNLASGRKRPRQYRVQALNSPNLVFRMWSWWLLDISITTMYVDNTNKILMLNSFSDFLWFLSAT